MSAEAGQGRWEKEREGRHVVRHEPVLVGRGSDHELTMPRSSGFIQSIVRTNGMYSEDN